MHALAETHVVCDVKTASPFLSCQVYIPSTISDVFVYIHIGRPWYIIKVAQKNETHSSVIFPTTVFSK